MLLDLTPSSFILPCLQFRTKPVFPLFVAIALKTESSLDVAARQKGDGVEMTLFSQWSQRGDITNRFVTPKPNTG